MTYMQKKWFKNSAIIIGFCIALSVYIIVEAWKIHQLPPSVQTIILFCLALIVFGMFLGSISDKIFVRWLDPLADKVFDEISRLEKGEEGENGVCGELNRILDLSKYTIHRNFAIPGKKFDIDAIVVGPKGVIVLEIKNYTKRMAFDGDKAMVETGNSFRRILPKTDPRNEVEHYSGELNKYFNANGLRGLPIRKAIAFLKKDTAIILSHKVRVYIISGPDELDKYIATTPDDPQFTPEFCEKINNVLSR